jgi:hypothetical protein
MQKRHLFFFFPVLVALAGLSCHKDSAANKESRYYGMVKLVQSSDYANIVVALYDVSVADSMLQVIQGQYPALGCKVTARDLFDHRKVQPVVRITAHSDGAWEITAPVGDYYVVASKEGFGWSYAYDVQPSSACTLELAPEVHLSGVVQEAMALQASRHYIVDRDFTVTSTGSLILEGGTWLRLNRSASFSCEGDFFVVGSVGHMVRITSNTYEPYAGDWNAIKLIGAEHSTLSGAVISFGGNGISLKNVRSLLINDCVFQDCKYTALLLNQVQLGEISHNVFQRNETGIFCQASTDMVISDNIYIANMQGIESESSPVRIENNYFHSCKMGVHAQFRPGPSVRHNLFEVNTAGVFCAGSNPAIQVNHFKNNTYGVEIGIEYSSFNADPTIHYNNFITNGNPVKLYGNAIGPNSADVDATYNYWNTPNVADIRQLIWDKQDAGQFANVTGTVLFSPFSTTPIDSAGIVNNN